MVGRDTGEQEEEGPKVERLVEEESKKEGEEEEGRAVEERTRRKIHSILESKFGFNRWIQCFKKFHTLILRDPAAKKWSMSMTDEQRKEAMSSFLVGEVARYQERTPRREWSRLGMRLCC